MDDSILTPKQSLAVASLRILRSMDPTQEVVPGVTVEDVERMTLNREWNDSGIDGVRLVESHVDR